MKLAIDINSSQQGIKVTLPSVIQALQQDETLSVQLFGNALMLIKKTDKLEPRLKSRITICNAPDRFSVDKMVEATVSTGQVEVDRVAIAASNPQKRTSTWQAVHALALGRVDAVVSACSTAGLVSTACQLLKMQEGVDTPALITAVATERSLPLFAKKYQVESKATLRPKYCFMLDLGANSTATPDQLVKFAQMGHCVAKILNQQRYPKIALLNTSHGYTKYDDNIVEAHSRLHQHSELNYTGFVVADQIFSHHADVIVCNGLLGNIALRSAEGAMQLYSSSLQQLLSQHHLSRVFNLRLSAMIRRLSLQLNPYFSNGMPILGLESTVIKSPSTIDVAGFVKAIDIAKLCVKRELPKMIAELEHH